MILILPSSPLSFKTSSKVRLSLFSFPLSKFISFRFTIFSRFDKFISPPPAKDIALETASEPSVEMAFAWIPSVSKSFGPSNLTLAVPSLSSTISYLPLTAISSFPDKSNNLASSGNVLASNETFDKLSLSSATAFTIILVSYSILLNFSPSPTWNLKLPSLSVSLFGTN